MKNIKRTLLSRISDINFKVKILLGVIVFVAGGLGLYGFFSMKNTMATNAGDEVTFVGTNKIDYGSYYTYQYTVTNNNTKKTYSGMCLEPSKTRPQYKTTTATEVDMEHITTTDYTKYRRIIHVMLATNKSYSPENNDIYSEIKAANIFTGYGNGSWGDFIRSMSEFSGISNEEDAIFAIGHAMAGLLYTNYADDAGLSSGTVDVLRAGINLIDNYMTYQMPTVALLDIRFYIGKIAGYQDIGWLEVPGAVSDPAPEIRIRKVDSENPNTPVSGAKYQVVKNCDVTYGDTGDIITNLYLTTESDGYSQYLTVEAGCSYGVFEVEPFPEGYLSDPDTHWFADDYGDIAMLLTGKHELELEDRPDVPEPDVPEIETDLFLCNNNESNCGFKGSEEERTHFTPEAISELKKVPYGASARVSEQIELVSGFDSSVEDYQLSIFYYDKTNNNTLVHVDNISGVKGSRHYYMYTHTFTAQEIASMAGHTIAATVCVLSGTGEELSCHNKALSDSNSREQVTIAKQPNIPETILYRCDYDNCDSMVVDIESGDERKQLPYSDSVKITEQVEMVDFDPSRTYYGEIEFKDLDDNVVLYTAEKNNLPGSNSYFRWTRTISTLGRAGHTIAAKVTVWECVFVNDTCTKGDVVVEHNGNFNDWLEAVTVEDAPTFNTDLTDGAKQSKVVPFGANVSLNEHVSLTNLNQDEDYRYIVGLVDSSEEKVADNETVDFGKSSAQYDIGADGSLSFDVLFENVDLTGYIGQKIYAVGELQIKVANGDYVPVTAQLKGAPGEDVEVSGAPTMSTTLTGAGAGGTIVYGVHASASETMQFNGLDGNENYKVSVKLVDDENKALTDVQTFEFGNDHSEHCDVDLGSSCTINVTFNDIDVTGLNEGSGVHAVGEFYIKKSDGTTWDLLYDHNEYPFNVSSENKTVSGAPEITLTTVKNSDRLEISNNATISDEVNITGLVSGESYRLVLDVYRGSSRVQTKGFEFTFTGSDGVKRETYDITGIDTTSLAGETLYVVARLDIMKRNGDYLEGISSHNVVNADSGGEEEFERISVVDAGMETKATPNSSDDGYTLPNGTKYVYVGNVTINDHVVMSGLTPDTDYDGTAIVYCMNNSTDYNNKQQVGRKDWQIRPTSVDGQYEYDVDIDVNTSSCIGGILLVEQVLHSGSTLVADHKGYSSDQSVNVVTPEVPDTYAENTATGNKVVGTGDVSVTDTVTYTGLKAGDTYTIKSRIKNGNQYLTLNNGNEDSNTTRSVAFVANVNGTTSTVLEFSTVGIADNATLLVQEYICDENGNVWIGEHTRDVSNQRITVNGISIDETVARNANGGTTFTLGGTGTVKDDVKMTGLVNGVWYKLRASLVDSGGHEITSSEERFQMTGTTGDQFTYTTTLSFDTKSYKGQTLTVFEELFDDNDTSLQSHKSTQDRKQQVTVLTPTIETTATNLNNGKTIGIGSVAIKDKVKYENLTDGVTYTLVTKLKRIGGGFITLTNGDSSDNTQKTSTFVASSAGQTTDQEDPVLQFSSADFNEGDKLVVFEYLFISGVSDILAWHEDESTTNNPQLITVSGVDIRTVATNANPVDSNTKLFNVGGAGTVKDEVTIEGLVKDTTYKLKTDLVKQDGTVVATSGMVDITMTGETGTLFSKTVSLTFNTQEYIGDDLTVMEYLYSADGSREITSHATIGDSDQTVTVVEPEIGTTATNADKGGNHIGRGNVRVKDVVSYNGLIAGRQYYLVTQIKRLSTGEYLTLTNGDSSNNKQLTTTFTASATHGDTTGATDGDKSPIIEFSATELEDDEKLVVHEFLYDADRTPIARHANDEVANNPQIIIVSGIEIETVAKNKNPISTTDDKLFGVGGNGVVTDTVKLRGLVKGTTYKLKTELVKQDGTVVAENGSAPESFVMNKETGEELEKTVELTFDSLANKGTGNVTSLTIMEYLYDANDRLLNSHATIGLESQTVKVTTPTVTTEATDEGGTSHELEVGRVTLGDKITYTGLVPGTEYTVEGKVMKKNSDGTAEQLVIDGVEVKKSQTLIPTKADDYTTMYFEFDTLDIMGEELVVYETIKYGDDVVASHEEPDAPSQIVTVKEASMGTEATDKKDDNNVIEPESEQVVRDTVSYRGLAPGEDYTLVGTLMNKETGDKLLINGAEVTRSEVFTADSDGEGTVEMDFDIDATELPGVKIVVFEKILQGTDEILTHERLEDDNQFVDVRSRIGTEAQDLVDGEQSVGVGEVTIVDTVAYEGLEMGKTYVMVGTLMDKETGQPVSSISRCRISVDDQTNENEDGEDEEICVEKQEEVTGRVQFTIGSGSTLEKDGTVQIFFTLNTRDLVGKELVAFERLYLAGQTSEEPISEHTDINDPKQTVVVAEPTVLTEAANASDGTQELDEKGNAIIRDKISYTGLAPGTKYTIRGVLMDKKTGKELTIKGAKQELTFTATRKNGYEEMEFSILTDEIAGKEIVVFETIYTEDIKEEDGEVVVDEKVVVEHTDLEAPSQTIKVKPAVVVPDTGRVTQIIEGAKAAGELTVFIVMMLTGGLYVTRVVRDKVREKRSRI